MPLPRGQRISGTRYLVDSRPFLSEQMILYIHTLNILKEIGFEDDEIPKFGIYLSSSAQNWFPDADLNPLDVLQESCTLEFCRLTNHGVFYQ